MKKLISVFLLLLCSLLLISCDSKVATKVSSRSSNESNLQVHFIDVGQGDSTLIITPDKKAMLIDAGDNTQGEKIKKYLKAQGISTIDVVIGTHPDSDHIGGIDYIINNFKINKFYMPKKVHTTKTFKDVLIAAKNNNLKITSAKAGISFSLGKDVSCSILNPIQDDYSDNNLYSVVTKVTYKNKSFLFAGDAEKQNEEEMIASNANLKSDVLKLGHHGSHSSTSEAFLKAVDPDVAVISCKYKNKYGHPHKEVLSLLKKYHIPLYRTDESSSIVFYSDGNEITTDTKVGSYKYYGTH